MNIKPRNLNTRGKSAPQNQRPKSKPLLHEETETQEPYNEYNGKLTPTLIQQLYQIHLTGNDEPFVQKLSQMLLLTDWRTNAKAAIEIDLYYCLLKFAFDLRFNDEKVFQLYLIVRRMHTHVSEETLEQSFQYFQESLLQITAGVNNSILVRTAPASAVSFLDTVPPTFSSEDAKQIVDYITTTYYQHFQLYRHVFTQPQEERTDEVAVYIETVLDPPSLVQGIPYAQWHQEQMQIQEEKEARQRELSNLTSAFQDALQVVDSSSKTTSLPSEVLPDAIKNLAATQASSEMDKLKQNLKQQLEQQEKNILDTIQKMDESGRKKK